MYIEADIAATAGTASTEARFLRDIVHAALARLPESHPELDPVTDAALWVDRACEVLARNIASGRADVAGRYKASSSQTLLSYAEQVLVALLSEWEHVERLREGDSASWSAVIRRLERAAYHWFGPAGREEWAAGEAREVAAQTCADLWQWLQTHAYPFDVSFDRWSARALNNRLRAAIRQRRAHSDYVVESLDRPVFGEGPTYGELVPAHPLDAWFEQAGNREALLQALAELDERQARVIRLWYLEGWPADEIAADLGQQVGYIYVLRFRAIEKLRGIITANVRLGFTEAQRFLKDEGYRYWPIAGRDGDEES